MTQHFLHTVYVCWLAAEMLPGENYSIIILECIALVLSIMLCEMWGFLTISVTGILLKQLVDGTKWIYECFVKVLDSGWFL